MIPRLLGGVGLDPVPALGTGRAAGGRCGWGLSMARISRSAVMRGGFFLPGLF
ncbi:MAG: hypothetical protein J2P48_20525 [Alphaproteobacteria bacterium]|nr:hypothetical protein [Alphaproteobacteria bacterium]